MEEAVLEST